MRKLLKLFVNIFIGASNKGLEYDVSQAFHLLNCLSFFFFFFQSWVPCIHNLQFEADGKKYFKIDAHVYVCMYVE